MENYKHLLQIFSTHLEEYRAGLSKKSPIGLYRPCSYILSLGGKRLRPLLALIAADLFDKDPRLALHSALAVELFHNFSLVHDDILDNAPLRRGKATVHVKWNTNTGILSGDVMLVEALAALQHHPPSMAAKLNALFNLTATQVCEGQQLDMDFEKARKVSAVGYIRMIELKTAVLLGCSLQMGAINAGAGAASQQHIYDFGRNLGIAFQLLDDYLDAFAPDTQKFGKQVGGDIIANKKTFLLIKAFEQAKPAQKKRLNELMAYSGKNTAAKVKGVLEIFKETSADRLCLAEADKYTGLAIEHLQKIKAPRQKTAALKDFALQLTQRQT